MVQPLSVLFTKRLFAAGLTALLLASLLGIAVLRSTRPSSETPEQCLEQMFQAMKAGDVPAYLACFSLELRQQLEATVRQQGAGNFARYLKDTAAPVKGRAVFAAQYAAPDRVRLKVDRVYEARMWEYQCYRLQRQSGVWTIYAIEPVELHESPVPYGAPAYPASQSPSVASAQESH